MKRFAIVLLGLVVAYFGFLWACSFHFTPTSQPTHNPAAFVLSAVVFALGIGIAFIGAVVGRRY